MFEPERIRKDFPILSTSVAGRPLVYLDNAATTQKPLAVINTLDRYYRSENANIHRGVHYLSQLATDLHEEARRKAARFFNASSDDEIIFVRGATEAINLIAHSFGALRVRAGDEILISHLEHHANIVPWQMLAGRTGAVVRVVPVTDDGEIDMDAFGRLLTPRTRLLAVTHVSNALGTVNPAAEIIARAHAAGIPVLLDGAQSAPHLPVDVQALGCDFFVCSGHKLYGPTGIGILYGRRELLETMPPWQGGGDMISKVTFEKTTFKAPPARFEAGTPNISGAIGLGAALDYLQGIGREAAAAHEDVLVEAAVRAIGGVPGVRVIGRPARRAGAVSFVVEGVHPHDVGTLLDAAGIAVRAGHHCAQPLMQRMGVPATVRASFSFYNTLAEVDALCEALRDVRRVFGLGG